VPVTPDSILCRDCNAYSPDDLHLLFIEEHTQVLDENGDPLKLIVIRKTNAPNLPLYAVLVSEAFDFTPSGTTFSKLAHLTLGHAMEDVPDDAARLLLAYFGEDGTWHPVTTDDTQLAGITALTGELGHFTVFATIAEVPGFEVSNLSVTPSRTEIWPFLTFAVRTGQNAEVSVDVANVGEHEADCPVILEYHGEVAANHNMSLAPGEKEQVVFHLTDATTGRHFVEVAGLTGEFTHSLWINWALIIGLGAGMVIVALLAFFGIRWLRRRLVV